MNMLLGTAPSLAQAAQQHEDNLYLTHQLAAQRFAQAKRFHEEKMEFKANQHKISARLDRQLYVTRMAHELDIARREAVRDVWKARNDNAQTMMIVESVFLAISYEILIGPKLPSNMSDDAIAAWSFFLGAGILFCIVSICLLLTQHARLARYDFQRPLHRYDCGKAHRDLNDYFRCHCQLIDSVGRGFFAAAVVANLTCCAVLGGSKWWSMFDDYASGILFAAPLAAAAIVVLFGPHFFGTSVAQHPTTTHSSAIQPSTDVGAAHDGAPHDGAGDDFTDAMMSREATSVFVEPGSPDFGGLRAEADEVEQMLTSAMPSTHSSFRASGSGSRTAGPAPPLDFTLQRLGVVEAQSRGNSSEEDGEAGSGQEPTSVTAHNKLSPKRSSALRRRSASMVQRGLFSRPTHLGAALDAGDEAFDAAALQDVENFSDDDGEDELPGGGVLETSPLGVSDAQLQDADDGGEEDEANLAEVARAMRAAAAPSIGMGMPMSGVVIPPASLRIRRRTPTVQPPDAHLLHAPFGTGVGDDEPLDSSAGFYTPLSRSQSDVIASSGDDRDVA